jgi:hypothetical protein
MDGLNSGIIDIDDVANTMAPKFAPTFTSLLDVMSRQEIKQRIKQISQSSLVPSSSAATVVSRKRPPQSPISNAPVKRTKQTDGSPSPPSEPKTPDQPTQSADPNWTGSTTESKDEENTKMLLKQFLLNTMSVLEGDFRRINWQRSGHKVELVHTFISLS